MNIDLQKVGKRYNREWIFRKLTCTFQTGNHYAIIGPNGSGKSTLLQIIGGATLHNEGRIAYTHPETLQVVDHPFQHVAVAAPYLELIEEMTALEILNFQSTFKSFSVSNTVILNTCGLTQAANKQIRFYSSGMKQRLKLGLAFYSKSSLLLLDEPTTNLDQQGIELYTHLIESCTDGKTVIIGSNDATEYRSCKEHISMSDYKEA
ncbi:MAG: ATP-binding cassette domain-containing protein [Ferruginibacter sp.]|nr:ATP-binding cassette domain-containing protein [Ferruginibacter sp.]